MCKLLSIFIPPFNLRFLCSSFPTSPDAFHDNPPWALTLAHHCRLWLCWSQPFSQSASASTGMEEPTPYPLCWHASRLPSSLSCRYVLAPISPLLPLLLVPSTLLINTHLQSSPMFSCPSLSVCRSLHSWTSAAWQSRGAVPVGSGRLSLQMRSARPGQPSCSHASRRSAIFPRPAVPPLSRRSSTPLDSPTLSCLFPRALAAAPSPFAPLPLRGSDLDVSSSPPSSDRPSYVSLRLLLEELLSLTRPGCLGTGQAADSRHS